MAGGRYVQHDGVGAEQIYAQTKFRGAPHSPNTIVTPANNVNNNNNDSNVAM